MLSRALAGMPKWLSDLLFALLLVVVYFVAGTYLLPRLGVPT